MRSAAKRDAAQRAQRTCASGMTTTTGGGCKGAGAALRRRGRPVRRASAGRQGRADTLVGVAAACAVGCRASAPPSGCTGGTAVPLAACSVLGRHARRRGRCSAAWALVGKGACLHGSAGCCAAGRMTISSAAQNGRAQHSTARSCRGAHRACRAQRPPRPARTWHAKCMLGTLPALTAPPRRRQGATGGPVVKFEDDDRDRKEDGNDAKG